jgi:hypothetical protein
MPIGLRGDFDAACLRAVARKWKDRAHARPPRAGADKARKRSARLALKHTLAELWDDAGSVGHLARQRWSWPKTICPERFSSCNLVLPVVVL